MKDTICPLTYRIFATTIVLLDLFSARAALCSPVPPAPQNESPNVSSPGLVTVHAKVADLAESASADLAQSAFRIFENDIEQRVTVFRLEEAALSIGLVIDTSASTRDKRPTLVAAVTKFLNESSPLDETFIVDFNDDAYLDQAFTNDKQKLLAAFENRDARGGTSMRDTISMAIDYATARGKQNRKALLIVTDGDDNSSHETLEQVVRKAQQMEVPIYCLGIISPDEPREARNARRTLSALAQGSGGMDLYITNLPEVSQMISLMNHAIHREYLLGYVPLSASATPELRKVNVIVNGRSQPPPRIRIDP